MQWDDREDEGEVKVGGGGGCICDTGTRWCLGRCNWSVCVLVCVIWDFTCRKNEGRCFV